MTLAHFLTSLNADRLMHDKDNDDDNGGQPVLLHFGMIMARRGEFSNLLCQQKHHILASVLHRVLYMQGHSAEE